LRSAVASRGLNNTTLAAELGIDPKTVHRWINEGRIPRRAAADKVAATLDVPIATLWPELSSGFASEVVHLHPRRADAPRSLWRQLTSAVSSRIEFMTYASAFFAEAVPDAVKLITAKADVGVSVRINLGDPDSPEALRRGEDEGIDVPGRIREAMAYYAPMVGHPGIEFRLHSTILYDSIYVFDDDMLVNQHALGCHGFAAPLLHLRRVDEAVMWQTYERSVEQAWSQSKNYTG
jgi:transcriptional regulator with XRE-family HTH domain